MSYRAEMEPRQVQDRSKDAFEELCACARPWWGGQGERTSIERHPVAGGSPDRWAALYQLASRHSIVPLVHMSRLYWGQVAEPLVQHDVVPQNLVQKDVRVTESRSRFMIGELGRILDELSKHHVEVIPFKGPTLTQRIYPALCYRFTGDLDLLVPSDASATLQAILERLGYTPARRRNALHQKAHTYISGQKTFVRGEATFWVDVHTRVVSRLYKYAPPFDILFRRSQQVDLMGREVRALSPLDCILMLCYQGAKNHWNRLKYVCDLSAALVATKPNGRELLHHARSWSGERVLLLGLHLAHTLLEAPVPRGLGSNMLKRSDIKGLARRAEKSLRAPTPENAMGLRHRATLQLMLQDSIGSRLRYLSVAGLRRLLDCVEQPTLD